jgi:hypothetical protein
MRFSADETEPPLMHLPKGYSESPPESAELIAQLSKTLTLQHESAHLAQYLSTSFGLRTLRHTMIAFRYLAELAPLSLPVGDHMWEKKELKAAVVRWALFLEDALELELHSDEIPPDVFPGFSELPPGYHAATVYDEPWTPLFLNPRLQDVDRNALPAALYELVQVRRMPYLMIVSHSASRRVRVNAASLMESFAIVHECLSLARLENEDDITFPRRLLENLQLVGAFEYLGCLTYAVRSRAVSGDHRLKMFAILVDVALMYDPFVLFDAPSVDLPTSGQPADQLPGDTFVRACAFASDLEPIRSADPEESIRYYNSLCNAMNIPSPDWMAQTAWEKSAEFMERIEFVSPASPMSSAFAMHEVALRRRREWGALTPIALLSWEGITQLLASTADYITFYDIDSANLVSDATPDLGLLSLHGLTWQALSAPTVQCPLQFGEPFSCASEDHNCRWEQECFVKNRVVTEQTVLREIDVVFTERPGQYLREDLSGTDD